MKGYHCMCLFLLHVAAAVQVFHLPLPPTRIPLRHDERHRPIIQHSSHAGLPHQKKKENHCCNILPIQIVVCAKIGVGSNTEMVHQNTGLWIRWANSMILDQHNYGLTPQWKHDLLEGDRWRFKFQIEKPMAMVCWFKTCVWKTPQKSEPENIWIRKETSKDLSINCLNSLDAHQERL